MPTYWFECKRGHLTEAEFRVAECPQNVTCGCGRPARKILAPVSVKIPPYMRAPGSSGSSEDFCERNKQYLHSDKHRQMREQGERIADRTSAAEQSLQKHIRDNAWKGDYLAQTGRIPDKDVAA